MYDNCRLWIDRFQIDKEVFQSLPTRLEKARHSIDLSTGEFDGFGYVDGLRVTIKESGISIKGSLSRFFYNDDKVGNLFTLDRHSTQQAIEKLSQRLGFDVSVAKVRALEFGAYFFMSNPVDEYLKMLGAFPRLERVHYLPETLYYRHRGKQQPKTLILYDKLKDSRAKNYHLPDGFDSQNILKYEIRFNGSLSKQIGWGDVTGSTLYDEKFYCRMIEIYKAMFHKIKKHRQVKQDSLSGIKSVGDAVEVLMARLLTQSNGDVVAEYLEELKSQKVFEDRANYSRLKKKLESVANKSRITESNELMDELSDCINNVGISI